MNKYIKAIKKYIKKNPEQAFLLFYNTGVYTWLQVNITKNSELNEISNNISSWIPMDVAKKLLFTSPYSWLIISIVITILIKKTRKTVKRMITFFLIVLGLILMYGSAKAGGWLT